MSRFEMGNLFTGELVHLGAAKADDKQAFARWSNDAEYLRQLNFDPAMPRAADHWDEKKDKDKKEEDNREYKFGIRTLADDKLIGLTGLWVTWNHQVAWFWIGIGEPEYRGHGYGTDTTRLIVNYAFRELGLYRVQLGVFGYNTRAQRVYEKVGFVKEGVQRAALYRDGQRHDLIGMGILRPEWETQYATALQNAEPALELR